LQDIELAGVGVGEIVLRMATCRAAHRARGRRSLGHGGSAARRGFAATRITPVHSGETTSPTVTCSAGV